MEVMNRPVKRRNTRNKKTLAPAKTLNGISAFQDEQGRVAIWPSARRRDAQVAVLEHLAAQFEGGRIYPQADVDAVLQRHVSLQDPQTLLDELVDSDYLRRDPQAGTYWRSIGRPTSTPELPEAPRSGRVTPQSGSGQD